MLAHMGSLQQAAYVRPIEYQEGRLDFDVSLFPYFREWKSMGAGDYVVGLEPSNSSVHGRGWHEQRGDLHTIAPQASERKSLTFTVIEGEAAIDALIARRDALLG